MVGSQYQAEIPPYLGRCSDDEKGKFFWLLQFLFDVIEGNGKMLFKFIR